MNLVSALLPVSSKKGFLLSAREAKQRKSTKRKVPVTGEANAQHKKNSRARLMLAICIAILALGFGLRYAIHVQSREQIRSLVSQIENAQGIGNWPLVENLAQQWATLEPQNYAAWRCAADAAAQMQNPALAVIYLEQMPEKSPLEAYLELGYLQMEMLNDPLGEFATCKKTLKVYPEDSETHERLLYFYTMSCQRDAIAVEAHRAIEVGSDTLATYAYLLGSRWLIFSNGWETNLKWLEAEPENELFEVAAVCHLYAHPLLEEMARETAAPDAEPRPLEFAGLKVEKLRETYPHNVELLALEISNLCRAGEVKQVAARLASAPPATANDNRFWRFKGWFHAAREEWAEAIRAYRKALELEPFDWAAQMEMATALRTTAGLAASAEMQERADLGKYLMLEIQDCKRIYQLEPPSLYDDMQRYFHMCGESSLADKLRERVAASQGRE